MTDPHQKRNFGFVAGRPVPTHTPPGDTPGVDEVIDAVAVLLDWRKRSSFRCLAVVRFVKEENLYELIARPRDLSYEITKKSTGRREFFDPTTGVLHNGDSERTIDASQLNWEHMAARLAFPVSLGIWGRPGDSYRMSGADRGKNEIVVALVHQKDPSLIGSLVIDLASRAAVRLDTPTLGIEYKDIQPA